MMVPADTATAQVHQSAWCTLRIDAFTDSIRSNDLVILQAVQAENTLGLEVMLAGVSSAKLDLFVCERATLKVTLKGVQDIHLPSIIARLQDIIRPMHSEVADALADLPIQADQDILDQVVFRDHFGTEAKLTHTLTQEHGLSDIFFQLTLIA